MYNLIRRALFTLSPETSHDLSLDGLGALQRLGVLGALSKAQEGRRTSLWGIEFENPVGLAAGLDKNADYLDALGTLGFGFVEVGTVTPLAQPGNPHPRLFRLPEHQAIINRMGFNNKGVDYLVERVKRSRYRGVIGINIGKNKDTPEENALDDYLTCLDKVYPHAHYVVVNVSSPNTPGLRNLQFGEALNRLLAGLKERQRVLTAEHGFKPLLIKIAPDMTAEEVQKVAQAFIEFDVDGVVATNTTLARDAVAGHLHSEESGGLSGAPLLDASTRVVTQLRDLLPATMPIIGVGGICSADDALKKWSAGADLVQLYSGFIYHGPSLIRECVQASLSAGQER
ncbi:quinone-dependent dihydroorotate dehydrogenase [Saccharospirillum impatiens]|uniref:quinone-dependent dihydroorotate dehydrogenase n=1 Tax=Saccharospirillum impatiens TaxID=169438 RepID=UPI00040D3BDE|nr:quinone-dependent dihydroorotate dehydrogenase [Saccharospirillum impatiens]